MAKTTAPKPNIIMRFVGYLGDVRRELKRVVWPSRSEVINSSLVVIVTLGFFVLFTFIVDSISVYAISLISKIGG
ncbi:MAG: preprotein translocase subunit SecE [Coriobacteriia bacterium]|jgi:preprotein translocase subunit SecE|nr:preprotein translocase subunit SecE [Coriobacteriia bacterium]